MKIFAVSIFSEESGPGSRPSVETFLFSSTVKRLEFLGDWETEQRASGNKHSDDEDLKYFGKGYVYWAETFESEIDCRSYFGQIIKRY